MAFWRKKKGKGANVAVTSLIGQDMELVGDVSFKGKLRLDGRIKGDVRGDYLILGEAGVVVGDILVNTFVCSGRVEGNVNVKKFQISHKGVINGKVEATDLEVESGAALSGEIKSRSKELRLVPGSSIPKEEWDAQVQEAAAHAASTAKKGSGPASSATSPASPPASSTPAPTETSRKQAAATG